MGLLDKALSLDSEKIAEVNVPLFFSPDLNSLFDSLKTSTKSLDFPSQLYTGLKKELHITKGALLLPDEKTQFVPWVVEGFDQTTSRRIRIPDSLLTAIKDSEQYTFIEMENDEVDLLKDFFSFREYSVTKKVLIAPIKSENQIVALLFISEAAFIEQPLAFKREILEFLSDVAGPLLLEKRENILNKLSVNAINHSNVNAMIDHHIHSKNKSFLLIELNIETFINEIKKEDSGSIDFRIMEDVLRLIKTLIGDRGDISPKDNRSFIILIENSRQEEAELFIHQIGLSLSFFYKVKNSLYKPDWNMVRFPDDGTSSESLLNNLQK